MCLKDFLELLILVPSLQSAGITGMLPLCLFYIVLGIDPRALYTLGRTLLTEPHPTPYTVLFNTSVECNSLCWLFHVLQEYFLAACPEYVIFRTVALNFSSLQLIPALEETLTCVYQNNYHFVHQWLM